MSKLKRAIIKEELVTLTGDFKKAIVLNQMIYWSERVKDFDKFIVEEETRSKLAGIETDEKELNNGWIYKKAEELAEETLMKVNKSTMSRCLDYLVKKGWLDRRRNPNPRFGYDKTYQYRVNLVQIQRDLNKLGYPLEGYRLKLDEMQNATSELPDAISAIDEMQNATSETQNATDEMQNATAIPEITNINYKTEITYKQQQQESGNSVVVVQDKYKSLFQKPLDKSNAQKLIDLADKHNVCVLDRIENTYTYHTQVKACRSIVGAITYAIQQKDGWEIPEVEEEEKEISPCIARELERRKKYPSVDSQEIKQEIVIEEETIKLSDEEEKEIREELTKWEITKQREIDLYGEVSVRTIEAISFLESQLYADDASESSQL